MVPVGLDETAAQIDLFADGHVRRGRNGRENESHLSLSRGVKIPFNRQRVFGSEGAIDPKTASEHVPSVSPILPGEVQHSVLVGIFRIHAVVRRLTRIPSILRGGKSAVDISSSRLN